MSHTAKITEDNPALADLELSWSTIEFSAEDGIGPLRSLHEAGDALVAIASLNEDGPTILGSGVMVGPGLLITATHVLEEFRRRQEAPLFMTFLPSGARAWRPLDMSVWTMPSAFDELRTVYSDRVSDVGSLQDSISLTRHIAFRLAHSATHIALLASPYKSGNPARRRLSDRKRRQNMTPHSMTAMLPRTYHWSCMAAIMYAPHRPQLRSER